MHKKEGLKALDDFVEEMRKYLPLGYEFSFFVTQINKDHLQGVWYLSDSKTARLKGFKKSVHTARELHSGVKGTKGQRKLKNG